MTHGSPPSCPKPRNRWTLTRCRRFVVGAPGTPLCFAPPQRLPQRWEAMEQDMRKLRGSQLVRLAAELHTALGKLEG